MRAVSCRRLGESRRSCTEAPLAGELLPYKGGMSMSWQIEKALDELVSQETGAVVYPFGTRRAMAICYPNTYDVAMSNLGMQIIYREVNGREDWLCERAFLPDKDLMKVFEKTGNPWCL